MPTSSSSVLLSLIIEDDEEVDEDEVDTESISTSNWAATRLETFPQTITPLLPFLSLPYGE